MNRSAASTARAQDEPADIDEDEEDEDANHGSDEDADSPARPIHDVSYVPSYPSKSTRSVLIRNGRGGGNSAMLDEAIHLPIAFSAGLSGGIPLSQLPDPHSTRDATASPDADGWKGAMDQEMVNLKSHDVYELVQRMNGMPSNSVGYSTGSSRMAFLRRIKVDSFLEATTNVLV